MIFLQVMSVCIRDGQLVPSEGSFCLRDTDGNLFQSLVKQCQVQVLEFLCATQGVLCEWLSMRGLSVSLSDLILCPDSCNLKQLMVDSCWDFMVGNNEDVRGDIEHLRDLAGCGEDGYCVMTFNGEQLCSEKQRSAAVSQSSVDALKLAFRDIQS